MLPTGGGKTVIAACVVERAVRRDERVLILTHRRHHLNYRWIMDLSGPD